MSGRRWLAPEIVQTSLMDCGPAALKCLLEGFGIPVSYGRLREACQTDVDGASIDAVEDIANRLGLVAEQAMLAPERVVAAGAVFPLLATVRRPDGTAHFVVLWRRFGPFVQVMDPAVGRRWLRADRLAADLHPHEVEVAAQDWRDWAGSTENLSALAADLRAAGLSREQAQARLDAALSDPGWRGLARLEAAARQALRLRRIAALRAASLLDAEPAAEDWPVRPAGEGRLILRGTALIRFAGRASEAPALHSLAPDLRSALSEGAPSPFAAFKRLLGRADRFAPVTLGLALLVSGTAALAEALLFRGLIDLGETLKPTSERLAAGLALVAFLALTLALRWPLASELMRLGRRLDVTLRASWLEKLARLPDRYFHSRAVADMAERAHALHVVRNLPSVGLEIAQSVLSALLTLAGVFWIDPSSGLYGLGLVAAAMATPLLAQPSVIEADLKLRNLAVALSAAEFDALIGAAPARAHRAERSLAGAYEAKLVEWRRASRRAATLAIRTEAVQQALGLGLAVLALSAHFYGQGGVGGADLLLVFWMLKLPALGRAFAAHLQHLPFHRNTLARVLEPLNAPEPPPAPALAAAPGPLGLEIRDGAVTAAGREVLSGLTLTIRPGEHVAVVGPSGAGKSSLLGLLLGWRGLSAGEARLGGVPLAPEALRARIAWVDPEVQIWNRGLLENLIYASASPDPRAVGRAIAAADLRGVLSALPEGLRSALGEGGALLSGGEGQRVRFGRALAQESADLALLDEPFRGLDRGQRRRLLQSARAHWREATLLCVTHDIEETLGFDRVLVIEDGRLVEDGHPAALAGSASRFRDLLEAETARTRETWAHEAWRRLKVEDGRVLGCG